MRCLEPDGRVPRGSLPLSREYNPADYLRLTSRGKHTRTAGTDISYGVLCVFVSLFFVFVFVLLVYWGQGGVGSARFSFFLVSSSFSVLFCSISSRLVLFCFAPFPLPPCFFHSTHIPCVFFVDQSSETRTARAPACLGRWFVFILGSPTPLTALPKLTAWCSPVRHSKVARPLPSWSMVRRRQLSHGVMPWLGGVVW